MNIDVILNQLIMLAIMMLIGFIGVKTKFLQIQLKDSISKIILRVTLPLLNLTSITGQTLRPEMIQNAGIIALVAIVVICLTLAVGRLFAKLFRLKAPTDTIHTCMSAFGNVIFLGYPLITALYGQEGLFYAIVYALVNDGFVWTLGVFMIAKSGGGDREAGLKKLINPNTVTFLISLLMLALGLRLPSLLHNTLAQVGSMTTCLSMLFIGMTLATIPLAGIYKRVSIYAIVLVKMLLIPAVLSFLLAKTNLDRVLLGVLLLQIAMPVQTIITVVANEFGSDDRYAAECVFITTIFSLATLPALYWFMSQIF